jgi:hypothetical protein
MGDTRRYNDFNNEVKLHKVKRTLKNRLDKHKNLIYNSLSSTKTDDINEQFDYISYNKFKRR